MAENKKSKWMKLFLILFMMVSITVMSGCVQQQQSTQVAAILSANDSNSYIITESSSNNKDTIILNKGEKIKQFTITCNLCDGLGAQKSLYDNMEDFLNTHNVTKIIKYYSDYGGYGRRVICADVIYNDK